MRIAKSLSSIDSVGLRLGPSDLYRHGLDWIHNRARTNPNWSPPPVLATCPPQQGHETLVHEDGIANM